MKPNICMTYISPWSGKVHHYHPQGWERALKKIKWLSGQHVPIRITSAGIEALLTAKKG